MTPSDFQSRYIASLPEVPEELRDELDLERFVVFDAEVVSELQLAPNDAAILTDVGLPNAASPWLTFNLDPKRRLAPVDDLPNMIAIGANAYGDFVCLDMDADAAVVYINHDNLNARVFINSSVSSLAESLCLYLTHRHNEHPKNLLDAIGCIDADAIVDGTSWHQESVALTESGG